MDNLSTSEQLAAKTASIGFSNLWGEVSIPIELRQAKWGRETAKFFFMLGVAWSAGKMRREIEQQVVAVETYLEKGK